jgi:hypothetical protein
LNLKNSIIEIELSNLEVEMLISGYNLVSTGFGHLVNIFSNKAFGLYYTFITMPHGFSSVLWIEL